MAPAYELADPASGSLLPSGSRTRAPSRASRKACHKPRTPAPSTVISRPSIPDRNALTPRVRGALQPSLAPHGDDVRARGHQIGEHGMPERFHFQSLPDGTRH